jgi:glycosyltransferase involved in cell wall biosynthesis
MHDMSIYRCPQFQPMKTVAVHRALIPILARRASLIVTVSESARQDILHYLKVPEERVRVIYGGIGHQFQTQTQPDQADTAQVRVRYRLEYPYILTVGTLEPRKNHARLIDAFSWLVQQERLPHHLVIAGMHGWKGRALHARVKGSKVANRIHLLGYVPAADLPGLYRGADAFAFPSLYEGFGLPILEAFGCGVPCLISSDAALTEVAGEGTAVAVEPHSVQDIAGGLQRLLADANLAQSLRARGLDRAREFSWDRCAAETFQLYQHVLRSRVQRSVLYCTR